MLFQVTPTGPTPATSGDAGASPFIVVNGHQLRCMAMPEASHVPLRPCAWTATCPRGAAQPAAIRSRASAAATRCQLYRESPSQANAAAAASWSQFGTGHSLTGSRQGTLSPVDPTSCGAPTARGTVCMSAYTYREPLPTSSPTVRPGGLLPGPRPGPLTAPAGGSSAWPRAASASAGSCHSYSPGRAGFTGAVSPRCGRETGGTPDGLAYGRGPSLAPVPGRTGPGWPLAAIPEAGRVVALEAPLVLPQTGRLPAKFVVSYIVVSNGLRSLILEGEDAGGVRIRAPIPLPAALLPDVQQPDRQVPPLGRVMQGMSSADAVGREAASGECRAGGNGMGTAGSADLAMGGVRQAGSEQLHGGRVHGSYRTASRVAGTQAATVAVEGGQEGEGPGGKTRRMGAADGAVAGAAAGYVGVHSATASGDITSPAAGLSHQDVPHRAGKEQQEDRADRKAVSRAPAGADGRGSRRGTAGQQPRQGTDGQPSHTQQQRHSSPPPPQQQGSELPALQRPDRPSVNRLLASFSPTVLVRRTGAVELRPGKGDPAGGQGQEQGRQRAAQHLLDLLQSAPSPAPPPRLAGLGSLGKPRDGAGQGAKHGKRDRAGRRQQQQQRQRQQQAPGRAGHQHVRTLSQGKHTGQGPQRGRAEGAAGAGANGTGVAGDSGKARASALMSFNPTLLVSRAGTSTLPQSASGSPRSGHSLRNESAVATAAVAGATVASPADQQARPGRGKWSEAWERLRTRGWSSLDREWEMGSRAGRRVAHTQERPELLQVLRSPVAAPAAAPIVAPVAAEPMHQRPRRDASTGADRQQPAGSPSPAPERRGKTHTQTHVPATPQQSAAKAAATTAAAPAAPTRRAAEGSGQAHLRTHVPATRQQHPAATAAATTVSTVSAAATPASKETGKAHFQTRMPAARQQPAAAAAAHPAAAPAAQTPPAPEPRLKPNTQHSALEQRISAAPTLEELSDILSQSEQEQEQEQVQQRHDDPRVAGQPDPAQTHTRGLAARPLRLAARRVLQLLQGGRDAPAHVPDPTVPNPGMRGAGVHGKGPVVEVLVVTRGKPSASRGPRGTPGHAPAPGGAGERGGADGGQQEQQHQAQQRMAAAKELLGWVMRRTGALVAGAEGAAAAEAEQSATEAAQGVSVGPQAADGDRELPLLLLQLVCCFAHLGAWVPWSEERALWAAGGAPEEGHGRGNGEAGTGSRQGHYGRGHGDDRGPGAQRPQPRSGLERLWAALLRQVCAAGPRVRDERMGEVTGEELAAGAGGMQGSPLAPYQLLWAVWAAAYSAPQALPALLRSLAAGGGGVKSGGEDAKDGRPAGGGGGGRLGEVLQGLKGLEALSDAQLVSVLWSAGQYAKWDDQVQEEMQQEHQQWLRRRDSDRDPAAPQRFGGRSGGDGSTGTSDGGADGEEDEEAEAAAAASAAAAAAAAADRRLVTRIARAALQLLSDRSSRQGDSAKHLNHNDQAAQRQQSQQHRPATPPTAAPSSPSNPFQAALSSSPSGAAAGGGALTARDALVALRAAAATLDPADPAHRALALPLLLRAARCQSLSLRDMCEGLELAAMWLERAPRGQQQQHQGGSGVSAATAGPTEERAAAAAERAAAAAAGSEAILALETAALRLLGRMDQQQAEVLLQLQPLGAPPSRSWYRKRLRLPGARTGRPTEQGSGGGRSRRSAGQAAGRLPAGRRGRARVSHPLPYHLRVMYGLGPMGTPAQAAAAAGSAGQLLGPAAAALATRRPVRTLQLQLSHQLSLYEDPTVRHYGTADLLRLLGCLAAVRRTAAAAPPPGSTVDRLHPRAATVRCALNALALRWMRSGAAEGDVRQLIRHLSALVTWRPRHVVTVFTTAWYPFVVSELQAGVATAAAPVVPLSDATLAGMAQVLGRLTSHDATRGSLAWPKLRTFWRMLLHLAEMRLAGSAASTSTAAAPQGQPARPTGQGAAPAKQRRPSRKLQERLRSLPQLTVGIKATGKPGPTAAAAGGAKAGAGGGAVGISMATVLRMVWSSARQGARPRSFMAAATDALLPHVARLPPVSVGVLAWAVGHPRYNDPRVCGLLAARLQRWLEMGPDCPWTAACEVSWALLRMGRLDPAALDALVDGLGQQLQEHMRQQHQLRHQQHMQQVQGAGPHGYGPRAQGGGTQCRDPRVGGWQQALPVKPRALAQLVVLLHGEHLAVQGRMQQQQQQPEGHRGHQQVMPGPPQPQPHPAASTTRMLFPKMKPRPGSSSSSTGPPGQAPAPVRPSPESWSGAPPGAQADRARLAPFVRRSADYLAAHTRAVPPRLLLGVLQAIAAGGAACRSEAFLVAFGHVVDSRPRWLLRRTVHVRQVLECYRRLGWWPAEQVEELVGRQKEVEAEVETARARRARRAAAALAVPRRG